MTKCKWVSDYYIIRQYFSMKTKTVKNVQWNSPPLSDCGYSIREQIETKQKYQPKEPKQNRNNRWNRGKMDTNNTHIHDL